MKSFISLVWSQRQVRSKADTKPVDAASLTREIEQLYETHAEFLLRFAIRATSDIDFAQESVQEAFLRYAEHRQREAPPPDALVWLLRHLRVSVMRKWRERDRGRERQLMKVEPFNDPAPSPEMQALLAEARRIIDRLAAPRELECFLLRSEGLSYEEIAQVMGIRIGTVGATLARAVRKLEQAICPVEER